MRKMQHSFLRQIRKHILSGYFLLVCFTAMILFTGSLWVSVRNVTENSEHFLKKASSFAYQKESTAIALAQSVYTKSKNVLLASVTKQTSVLYREMVNIQSNIENYPAIHSLMFYNRSEDCVFVFGKYCSKIPMQEFKDREKLDEFSRAQAGFNHPYAWNASDSRYLPGETLVYSKVFIEANGNMMVLNMNAENLFFDFRGYVSDHMESDPFLIFDQAGNILFCSDIHFSEQLDPSLIRTASECKGKLAIINGDVYHIVSYCYGGTSWSVMSFLKATHVYASYVPLLFIFALCLPVGFLIALLYERRLQPVVYSPFSQFISKLDLDSSNAHFDHVMKRIADITVSHNEYSLFRKYTLENAQQRFLVQHFQQGTESEELFRRKCKLYGLPYADKPVLLIYGSWSSSIWPPVSDPPTEEVLYFSICNVFQELCPEVKDIVVGPLHTNSFFIIGCPTMEYDAQALSLQVKVIHHFFEEYFSVCLFFGVSDVIENSFNLKDIHQQLLTEFQNEQFYTPESFCMFYSQRSAQARQQGLLRFDDIPTLKKHMCAGEVAEVEKTVKQYFGLLQRFQYHDIFSSLFVFSSQLDSLLRELAAIYPNIKFSASLRQDLSAPTLAHIRNAFISQLVEVANEIQNGVIQANNKLIHDVISFLEDNYANSNLSAKIIASSCNLSATALNRLCNQETGLSIMGYLKQVRLRHACDLLKNTNANVETIAEKVGFENTKYFHTVFKEEYGTSPAKYRKISSAFAPGENLK